MPIVLAALPEVIMALCAVIIIIGGALLVEYIGRAIGIGIHIPGLSYVVNWVNSAAQGAIDAMASWLDSIARGVVSAITAIPVAIANIIQAIETFAWAHWAWLHTLITQTIPQLWSNLWSQIAAVYHYFDAYISQVYTSLVNYASDIERYLIGFINGIEGALVAYIQAVQAALAKAIADGLSAVTAYALSLYNSAISFVDSIYSQLTAFIATEIAAAEQYAEQLANWALSQAVQLAEQYAKAYADWAIQQLLNMLTFGTALALAPAWPRVVDAIDAISAAIPGVLEDILEDIRSIPRVLPASIPAILAALLGVISLVAEYVARCGTDLCRNLHGFGDEVASLSDAALTAGMIAFVVAAIESPEATARETDALAIEPLIEVGKGFADVVGTVF